MLFLTPDRDRLKDAYFCKTCYVPRLLMDGETVRDKGDGVSTALGACHSCERLTDGRAPSGSAGIREKLRLGKELSRLAATCVHQFMCLSLSSWVRVD